MQSYGNPNVTYDWWAGNSGVAKRSGTFIAAHAAHAGLIMFWAGSFTLFELAKYDPSLPMGGQGLILLPHLASLGFGVGEGGVITDMQPYYATAVLHLVSSAVLAAAGIWHQFRAPEDLSQAQGRARKFHFSWDDPKKLGFILGHHLIFLGLGAIAFVELAKRVGIYDPAQQAVRTVQPNIDLGMVWGYQTNFIGISSLEDVIGGHAVLSFILLFGGVWHIIVPPYGFFRKVQTYSGEAILSYSLGGIALMGFVASYWCAANTTVYPEVFYGAPLTLKFAFSPYFADTESLGLGVHSARAWLANTHFYLAFFFLQGHLWHCLRSLGFNFKSVEDAFNAMDTAKIS